MLNNKLTNSKAQLFQSYKTVFLFRSSALNITISRIYLIIFFQTRENFEEAREKVNELKSKYMEKKTVISIQILKIIIY